MLAMPLLEKWNGFCNYIGPDTFHNVAIYRLSLSYITGIDLKQNPSNVYKSVVKIAS